MLQPFSCLFPHPVHDRDEVAQELADIGKNLPGSEDLAELAVCITFGVVQPVEEFGIGFQKSLVSVAVEALLEELESHAGSARSSWPTGVFAVRPKTPPGPWRWWVISISVSLAVSICTSAPGR